MWSVCSDYLLGYSFVFLVQINVMSDIILSGCDSIRQLPNIWSDHQCNMLMLGISDMELMWTVQAIHTIFGCECRTVLLTCTNEEMTKSAPTVWQSLPPLVALDHTRLFLENIPPNFAMQNSKKSEGTICVTTYVTTSAKRDRGFAFGSHFAHLLKIQLLMVT